MGTGVGGGVFMIVFGFDDIKRGFLLDISVNLPY